MLSLVRQGVKELGVGKWRCAKLLTAFGFHGAHLCSTSQSWKKVSIARRSIYFNSFVILDFSLPYLGDSFSCCDDISYGPVSVIAKLHPREI
jgi:hypothetical protein